MSLSYLVAPSEREEEEGREATGKGEEGIREEAEQGEREAESCYYKSKQEAE